MEKWGKGPDSIMTVLEQLSRLWKVLTRIATMSMPTLAVLNGHTYASGVWFSMCFDHRIMNGESPRYKFCLSEANLGITLPLAAVAL